MKADDIASQQHYIGSDLRPTQTWVSICTAEAPATAKEASLCRKIKKSEGRRHRPVQHISGDKTNCWELEDKSSSRQPFNCSGNIFECKWRWQECVLGREFSWERGFLKQRLKFWMSVSFKHNYDSRVFGRRGSQELAKHSPWVPNYRLWLYQQLKEQPSKQQRGDV